MEKNTRDVIEQETPETPQPETQDQPLPEQERDVPAEGLQEETASDVPEDTESSEVEQLRREVEVARDRMLRAAAEFENYKKRAEREKNEYMKYVAEGFIADLLPVLDNLERAISSSEESGSLDSIREGVEMIHKQLLGILEKRGVQQIDALGKMFDPEYHEAMAQVPSDEPENMVIQEFQKGYQLHDRVIRPSRVIVSQGPQEESEGESQDG